MSGPSDTGSSERSVAVEPVPDGGKGDDGDERRAGGRDEEPDRGSEGGFWPWSGRRRIRELGRELREVRAEREALQSDVERLESQLAELETEFEELQGVVDTVERKTFPVREFVQSVGESVWDADRMLRGSDFGVADVEVTLRSRFAGDEGGLSVQLPDPDEEVDAGTLSDLTFRVGRGVSRGEPAGPLAAGGAMPGGGPDGELAEVPDVRELSLERAREELSEAGFEAAVEYSPGATPEGAVLDQDPDPFLLGPEGAAVHLVVAGTAPES
jgi:hypothetical protein